MRISENALVVTQLQKIFNDGFEAVKRISFNVQSGKILGLLGPNGAGKTTTMQMLLGIMTPTDGDIKYFGKSIRYQREMIIEDIGFASSYVRLPGKLTVLEALNFYGSLYRKISGQIESRIAALAEIFDIQHLLSKPCYALSAGQATRVMLAKAFIAHPKLVLLDEPTASLDPDIAQQVLSFIKKQQEFERVTVLFTSHKMEEVSQLCDEVIVLKQGIIVDQGTPEELTRHSGTVHISLMSDYIEHIIALMIDQPITSIERQGNAVSFSLKESAVSDFLALLVHHNIDYQRISIQPATLHDYFLTLSRT